MTGTLPADTPPQLCRIKPLSPLHLSAMSGSSADTSSPMPPLSPPDTPTEGGKRVQQLLQGQNSPYGATVRRASRGISGQHLVDLSQKVEMLQSENHELQQNIKAQKAALAAAEDDTRKLQTRSARLADELESANKKLTALSQALEMERQNSRAWMAADSAARRDARAAQARETALRRDNAALRTCADKIRRFTDAMMRVMAKETDEIGKWKRLFRDYKELVASYLDDLNKVARERLLRSEEAINSSMATVEQAREIIRKAKQGIEASEERCETAKKKGDAGGAGAEDGDQTVSRE